MSKLIAIWPGTPEWKAWLEYHRGTKTVARMLSYKHQQPPTPWLAPTKFPANVTPDEIASPLALPRIKSAIKARQVDEAKGKKRRMRRARNREKLRNDALLAASKNNRPRIGECDDLDVLMVIDPMEGENLLHVDRGAPIRMTNPEAKPRARVISLRDDPIGKMAKLGRLGINEDRNVRLMAARKWQEFYDVAAEQSGLDPSADVVNGGKVDDIAEQRLTAIKALSKASQRLGKMNENLIYQILGARHSLEEWLDKAGMLEGSQTARQKMIDAYLQILRNCLDDLAVEFRFRVIGKGPARPRDQFERLSRYASQPRLYDAIHRAKQGS